MWISRYVVWLVIYSVLGWIYESTYCSIVDRKWANRGFLYGPLCPIYGFGVIGMIALWQAVLNAGVAVEPWQVFAVAAAGSAVLEYATSWVLERLFHARWWDYTNMPLNLNGRICLPATVLFGLGGLLVAYVLYEPTVAITNAASPVLVEGLSLLLIALVSVDATLTVSALTRFAHAATSVSNAINEHMDQFVAGAVEKSEAAAGAFAQERERFGKTIRASRVGEMGALAVSAARRIHKVIPASGDASLQTSQLDKLLHDLRELRG